MWAFDSGSALFCKAKQNNGISFGTSILYQKVRTKNTLLLKYSFSPAWFHYSTHFVIQYNGSNVGEFQSRILNSQRNTSREIHQLPMLKEFEKGISVLHKNPNWSNFYLC